MDHHPYKDIATRLQRVRQQIIDALLKYGRQEPVDLIAVSKTQPIQALEAALQSGQLAFGENYCQEALPKIQALQDKPIVWHFIGPIQSNKTKAIAEHFAWVHTIDRIKIAERLSQQRSSNLPPLQVLIQVNVNDEASKSGVSFEGLPDLAQAVSQLPRLQLRGLMAIPKIETDFERQRASFSRLRKALEELQQNGLRLDTLSMGMSDDFVAAIAEGATMVRIGTAIFGSR